MERISGFLLPLFSLPANQGIGDLGYHAIRLIDALKKANIKIWQILPLNPTGYGHSPYQPYSSFAGDEIYISLDRLADVDLIKRSSIKNYNKFSDRVDYEEVRLFKERYFKKAYRTFKKEYDRFKTDYEAFVKEASWVYNYAVFMTLKKKFSNRQWLDWPIEAQNWIKDKEYDLTELKCEIEYEIFLQFIFYSQWDIIKKYANEAGISIMGDIPFYVGLDSSDAWENQNQFLLDESGHPTHIAGVPPDYFSQDGQRWGNPIYDWKKMKKDGYAFWVKRLAWNKRNYDMIRIDHFRAFDTYWKIIASCETARDGEWVLGPSNHFFDTIYKQLPDLNLVAEDLGDIRKEVIDLKNDYNLMGMKVMEFEMDPSMLKQDYDPHVIYYTGTHDNDTLENFYQQMNRYQRVSVRRYLHRCGYDNRLFHELCLRYVLDSDAEIVILPAWDILGLKRSGRINTPGTISEDNWSWKLKNNKLLFKKLETISEWIVDAERD